MTAAVDAGEIFGVTCIGQRVVIYDSDIVRPVEGLSYKSRADESGTAGHKDIHNQKQKVRSGEQISEARSNSLVTQYSSILETTHLSEQFVGIFLRRIDVIEHDLAALLAGVVDHNITEAE